jgi:uncharacterized membrane protein
MPDQPQKISDSNLVSLYREILNLRSIIELHQDRICALEKTVNELSELETKKRQSSVSVSPLQQKILSFLKDGAKTQEEISQTLGMPQPSVSHSLNKLEKEMEIVESKPTNKPGARFEYVLRKNLSKESLELLSQL